MFWSVHCLYSILQCTVYAISYVSNTYIVLNIFKNKKCSTALYDKPIALQLVLCDKNCTYEMTQLCLGLPHASTCVQSRLPPAQTATLLALLSEYLQCSTYCAMLSCHFQTCFFLFWPVTAQYCRHRSSTAMQCFT